MAEPDASPHLLDLITEAGTASDITRRAAALAELQRASASALRATVMAAREQGMSWRELAAVLRMAKPTLYGQYRAGNDVVAVPPHRRDGHAPDVTGPAEDLAGPADPVERDSRDARPQWGPQGPPAGMDLFVGRRQELADLRPLLSRSRLVTLVGPAGVGKTRLATEFIPGAGQL